MEIPEILTNDPEARPTKLAGRIPATGWVPVKHEVAYDNPWIKVTQYEVIDPSGNPGIYGLVHFKRRTVGVIAINGEGNTYLVGQTRFPLGRFEYEIPAGGLDEGETLEEAARRELEEETGLHARKLKPIQVIHPSNGITDEESTIFIAWDLVEGELARESTEDIQMLEVSVDDAISRVLKGELSDAPSVTGLLRLKLMILDGSADEFFLPG